MISRGQKAIGTLVIRPLSLRVLIGGPPTSLVFQVSSQDKEHSTKTEPGRIGAAYRWAETLSIRVAEGDNLLVVKVLLSGKDEPEVSVSYADLEKLSLASERWVSTRVNLGDRAELDLELEFYDDEDSDNHEPSAAVRLRALNFSMGRGLALEMEDKAQMLKMTLTENDTQAREEQNPLLRVLDFKSTTRRPNYVAPNKIIRPQNHQTQTTYQTHIKPARLLTPNIMMFDEPVMEKSEKKRKSMFLPKGGAALTVSSSEKIKLSPLEIATRDQRRKMKTLLKVPLNFE